LLENYRDFLDLTLSVVVAAAWLWLVWWQRYLLIQSLKAFATAISTPHGAIWVCLFSLAFFQIGYAVTNIRHNRQQIQMTERRLAMRIEDIEQQRRRDARALAAIIDQTGATLEAIPAAIRQQVDRKDAARRPM
jgi:hypothetical protein